MVEKWRCPISATTIGQALKKNWFYEEKKTYSYRETDEKARAKFIEQRKNYARERLVYVDEAGVDNSIDYPY